MNRQRFAISIIDQATNKTDMSVSIRPSEKMYKYYGRDSIKLIFRRIGPTERLYSKGGNNEVTYPME